MAKRRNIFVSTRHPVPKSAIDVAPPPNSGLIEDGGDTSENFAGIGALDFPNEWWIEPKDWGDVARENDGINGRSPMWARSQRERLGRHMNQSPTSQCVLFTLAQMIEQCTREMYGSAEIGGRKGSLCVSPQSGYAQYHSSARSSPRSGANGRQALAMLMKTGLVPESCREQNSIFPITMDGTVGQGYTDDQGIVQNSHGPWVRFSEFPDGWKSVAVRVLEAINPRTIEEVICMVLRRVCVGVGRNSHEIPYDLLAWTKFDKNNPFSTLKFGYTDSYVRVLWDSLRTARGCVNTAISITSVKRSARFSKWLRTGKAT